jgi:hypothetical protein
MKSSDLIEVGVYPAEALARIAASALEAAGIAALVTSDDVGGTVPGLHSTRGVHLLVNREDEERARAVLAEGEDAPPASD